ncbi:MAG: right-handed parallel beta-helix repeat-containing protein [Desulfobacteraceae bacterium]|nr:right-handed parallel beta-helix repeat-containing protein [Desulfobacteraceae bacterium]
MMKKTITFMFVLVACFFATASIQAATYTVDDDDPSADFSNIQDAIDDASSGDIIYVFPGLYNEHVDMKDGVNLFGAGPDVCTIKISSATGPVIFRGTTPTIISGFKITGGSDAGIKFCGPLIVTNNIITGNRDGIDLSFGHRPIVSTIVNNTIANNEEAGIFISNTPAAQVIKNNIIVSNGTHGIFCDAASSTGNISYNDVWNNNINYFDEGIGASFTPLPGTGEIHQDPLFEDSDYHLAEASPCIDKGAPGTEYNDPDGTRNDMGAYGSPGAAGGRSSFAGSGFIFTSIGKIPTSEITQDSANVSHGLANVSDKVASDFKIPKYTDSPFGGNLWIHGLFGSKDNVNYYQILVGKWINGKPPAPGSYACLNDPLTKVRYIINPDGTVSHQYVNLGPKSIGSTDNLYQLTREGFWTHIDLRIIWNTRSWENGKYTLTYKAYRWDNIEGLVPVFPESNKLDHITIIVDNSPVEAIIHNVKYDPSNPNYASGADGEIPECGIINLIDKHENLRFTITAWHPDGYLKNCILDTLYGKNRYGGVIQSEHYNAASPPYWHGVEEKEFQSEDAAPGDLKPWESCTYQFRLRAWSRTTDGYHYIIWKEFNDHYYLDMAFR